MNKLTIGIFNDSFPPTIDGVANVAFNYAREIQRLHGQAIVATPWYPNVRDQYPFEVIRYPSAYVNKKLGYRAGYPFDPKVLYALNQKQMNLIHLHCPFISAVLARTLRYANDIPLILTYHTKYDIDINKVVALNPIRSASLRFLISNINACDEIWTVSRGAGENLRSLGYEGDYRVMENGTDFDRRRAPDQTILDLKKRLNIHDDAPIYLYVGRHMWYKGIRLILDGLRRVKENGRNFHMVFVGDGYDRPEIEDYAQLLGLMENCHFVGAIHDREKLRVYFSLADLFLFPSSYDTNGIVVNEAAACSCPSLLIRNSAAAEQAQDQESALLINETAFDLADCLTAVGENREFLKRIGKNASESIYLSWETAVNKAYRRYEEICDSFVPQKNRFFPPDIFFDNVQRIKNDLALRRRQVKRVYSIGKQRLMSFRSDMTKRKH
ncbi:MAG TPA: glycosyltransferase family 4 protein [Clostridiales bacterium]|nr:glycosyltransferase family 4 protein [Clostridiales bacterium]